MQLRLTNFRCWEDKVLSIPDKGICLLSGRSGRGKSTILNSIVYTITGKGKNISTFQKKSTSVQLEIDGLVITRQRGPNRLIVKKGGVQYEDDAAQSIIDSTFGAEFCNTSYIDQENANSFVFLSPSEKIEFLEKLLLSRYNIDEMKDRVKDDISKTKLEHAATDSKLTTLSDMLRKMTYTNQEDVHIETNRLTSQNCGKLLEKIRGNIEITEKNEKSISTKIKKWENERVSQARLTETRGALKVKSDDVDEQLSKCDDLEMLRGDMDALEKRKNDYHTHQSYVKRRELEASYNERVEHNAKEKEQHLAQLQKIPTIDIIKKSISQLESVQRIMDTLISLEDKIASPPDETVLAHEITERDKIKERLALCQKTIADQNLYYPCPSCKNVLQFDKDKLVMGNVRKIENVGDLKREVKDLAHRLEETNTRIDQLKAEKVLFDKNEAEYNQLFDRLDELLKLPTGDAIEQEMVDEKLASMVEMKAKYETVQQSIREVDGDRFLLQLKKEMELLPPAPKGGGVTEDIPTEQEYSTILETLAAKKEMAERVRTLTQKRKQLTQSWDELPVPEKTDEELAELLAQNREKVETYRKKTEQYRTHLQRIEKWEMVERDNTAYQEIQVKIVETEEKKVAMMDRLRCLVKLRDHIKQAEQQSLSEFIDALNRHAAIYIEDFFPDDDITVELKTVQEGKSTGKEKVTLHFDVQYREMNGDLSFLSGGEKDRVNLAFTLAFSELVENRILLLDECISSLDAETSNVVLGQLKEKYKGKLVIAVSHQANLGFFDDIINL
jgi:DNA repair exonuclease SbcCD ATPase subunit